MKFNEHPIIRKLLNQILREEREGLLRFIMSRGVPKKDAEDVLQMTLERVLNLDIPEQVENLLREALTEELRDRLRNSLKAIIVHWLKLNCLNYLKKSRNHPLPVNNNNVIFADNQLLIKLAFRKLIIELTSPLDVNVETVCDWLLKADSEKEPGDLHVLDFVKHMTKLAGCTNEEEEFILRRVTQPDLPDKDIFPEKSKASISRIKKPLFLKICKLLDVKIPFSKQKRKETKKCKVIKMAK